MPALEAGQVGDVTTASGFVAARAEMSITTIGMISSWGVMSGESRPPSVKCRRSMCVPECSPNVHFCE